ncbi:MAG: serine hydrolase domain-containing protein [Bryobacteraceae bacterium]
MNRRQFAALPLAAAAPYYPPPDAAGGWRFRAPGAAALDKLDAAFERARGATKHGGLLVVHGGWLVYERYFGRAGREATPNGASMGKSFTSIAIGMLLAEHAESFPEGLDQKVYTVRYLPPEAFPLSDPAKAEIKLGHLLTMTAGLLGNNPAAVRGKSVTLERTGPDGWQAMVDAAAFSTPLWTRPGEGWCYATVSPHLLSIIVRRLAGMELQEYLDRKLGRPLGWGRWGYGYRRAEIAHTPGGGGIALRPTDMLRFLHMLLHDGVWNGRRVAPAEYVRLCRRPSRFNPHRPAYGMHFYNNATGEVAGAPPDAFWFGGSGGYNFYVVPSLDLAAYRIGGRDEQYNLALTNVPPPPGGLPPYDGSRESWKAPRPDPNVAGEILRLVCEAFR